MVTINDFVFERHYQHLIHLADSLESLSNTISMILEGSDVKISEHVQQQFDGIHGTLFCLGAGCISISEQVELWSLWAKKNEVNITYRPDAAV